MEGERNYDTPTCLSFIEHKNHEIACNLDSVIFLTDLAPKLALRTMNSLVHVILDGLVSNL